jgi:anti-anti-sigma regulatory factor
VTRCSADGAQFDPATDLCVSVCVESCERTRVIVRGAIDLHTAPRLRLALDAAIREGSGSLIVDAAGLAFGGADFVSALLDARTKLRELGRCLLVVNAPEFFRRVLAACQLDDLAG